MQQKKKRRWTIFGRSEKISFGLENKRALHHVHGMPPERQSARRPGRITPDAKPQERCPLHAIVTTLRTEFAAVDFSLVGGIMLFVDMLLFSALAAFWEPAGRVRFTKRDASRKR